MSSLLELEEGYGDFVVALGNILEDYEDRLKKLEEETNSGVKANLAECECRFTQKDLNSAVQSVTDQICYIIQTQKGYCGMYGGPGLLISRTELMKCINTALS